MTFTEAKKQANKIGYKHVEGKLLNLVYCLSLSLNCCLTEKSLWDWAECNTLDLKIVQKSLIDKTISKMDIVEMVMDNNTKYLNK